MSLWDEPEQFKNHLNLMFEWRALLLYNRDAPKKPASAYRHEDNMICKNITMEIIKIISAIRSKKIYISHLTFLLGLEGCWIINHKIVQSFMHNIFYRIILLYYTTCASGIAPPSRESCHLTILHLAKYDFPPTFLFCVFNVWNFVLNFSYLRLSAGPYVPVDLFIVLLA